MATRDLEQISSFATLAYTGTAANGSAVTQATGVNTVVLSATTACYVTIGVAAVATSTNGIPLGIGQKLVLPIRVGERVSAIQQSAGGNLGIAYGAV